MQAMVWLRLVDAILEPECQRIERTAVVGTVCTLTLPDSNLMALDTFLDVVWSTLQDGTSKGVDRWLWVCCSNNSVAVARLPCSHPGHAWKLGNMYVVKKIKTQPGQKKSKNGATIEQQREKTKGK